MNTENAPSGGLITLITHLFAVSREPVLGKGLSSITLKGLIALIAHHFLGRWSIVGALTHQLASVHAPAG